MRISSNDLLNEIILKKNNIPGLYNGDLGIVVACLLNKRPGIVDSGLKILDEHLNNIRSSFPNFSLVNGLSGLGWTLTIAEDKSTSNYQKILENIDSRMNYIVNNVDINKCGMLTGLSGIGLYALRRGDHKLVQSVIKKIYVKLSFVADECYVVERNEKLKYCNLGLPHGITGIIFFLNKCIQQEIETSLCFKIIKGMSTFMLRIVRTDDNPKKFPAMFWFDDNISKEKYNNDNKRSRERLGWCYGDVPAAIGLYWAAKALSDERLLHESLKIVDSIASNYQTVTEESKIVDASICHGTSGLVLFFDFFEKNCKLPYLSNATSQWKKETFLMSKHSIGIAGYAFEVEKNKFIPENNLLNGAVGILLSMSIDELTNDCWKELFCLY